MPTFRAYVAGTHRRKSDGKYQVTIRVIHKREKAYIPTGVYVEKSQLYNKSFYIKDCFVLDRMRKTIKEMEEKLLTLSLDELNAMSAKDIKDFLSGVNQKIDFIEFCEGLLVEESHMNNVHLRSALSIIKDEMGITSLPVTSFTSHFVTKFIATLDAHSRNGKKLGTNTKESYLTSLIVSFRKMRMHYNTEFNQIIKHDPFTNVKHYIKEANKKRAATIDDLRAFFEYVPSNPHWVRSQDAMKISFCMCGMNFKDMYKVQASCYDGERITYNRSKTENQRPDKAITSVKVQPEIKDLIKKYKSKKKTHLFDYADKGISEESLLVSVNTHIRKICEHIGIPAMTTYWFRHSWATIARNYCGVSKDDISLGLNHVSIGNKMDDMYITNDYSLIDNANRKVIDFVFHYNE